MVNGPTITATLFPRNTRLASNKKPAPGISPIDLVACEQARVRGKQTLEKILGVVQLLSELH